MVMGMKLDENVLVEEFAITKVVNARVSKGIMGACVIREAFIFKDL